MFTKSVHINVCDFDVINHLNSVGYTQRENQPIDFDSAVAAFTNAADGTYVVLDEEENEYLACNKDLFLCGQNKKLFYAVSALRDDSPFDQWYWKVENHFGEDRMEWYFLEKSLPVEEKFFETYKKADVHQLQQCKHLL